MAHTYGTIPTSESTVINGDINGTVKTIVKSTAWADYSSAVPALGTVDPDDNNFFLVSFKVESQKGLAVITLNYGTLTNGSTTLGGIPATTYIETSSTREEKITHHPDFDDWVEDWDEANERFRFGTDKYDIESYYVGTTQVTRTDYYGSLPSSDRDNIGKRESPGSSYGDDTNWLLIASNRRKEGYYFTKENTYLFDPKPWNTDVYPVAD